MFTRPDDPRGAHMADRLATHMLAIVLGFAIIVVIVLTFWLSRSAPPPGH